MKPSERPTVTATPGKPPTPTQIREPLLPAVEAVRRIIGRAPAISTIHRWALRGVLCDGERIQLEAYRIGGRLCASLAAVQRFIDATATRKGIEPPTPPRSDSSRAKAVAIANKKLDRAGV